MFISQIIQYTILPAFIILVWIIVYSSYVAYEKKFPDKPSDKQ